MGMHLGWRVLVVALWIAAALESPAAAQVAEPGDEFPSFSARDALSGDAINLADFRGKVVLIDFWATWCGPCVNELPNVKSVYSRYHDEGFEIISISLDSDRRRFENFVRGQSMRWHHVMQGGGWNTPLAKKFNIRSIPAMFLLDHEGKVISTSARGSRLESLVERALEATPQAIAKEYVESREEAAPAEPVRPQAPALDPAVIDEVRATISGSDESLQRAAEAFDGVQRRLLTAAAVADALARELPTPVNERSTQTRFADLLTALHELRRELFIMGLPIVEAAAMPGDPFGESGRASQVAFVNAQESVEQAQRVLGDFAAAIEGARRELGRAGADIAAVRAMADSGYGDGGALLEQAHGAADNSLRLAERWREPWKARLAEANAIIVDAAAPITDALGAIDSLELQIAACRATRASILEPDDDALRGVREEFNSVREGVGNCTAVLVELGVLSDELVFDLHDPFENRLLRDRRNLTDLDAQLDAAEQAAATLREAASEVERRLSEYSARLETLQAEAAANTGSPRRMAAVREEFMILCDELLAFGAGRR